MGFSAISEAEMMEIDGGKVTWKQVAKILWEVAKYAVTHRPVML